ncbi:hypothetical protein SUGI_0206540 [Cryptomeria japonica]|uniref:uncharacterized protein LOC131033531 n=1 Tax=Cryptomeria japonica TaxID=3369 RepID=UPI002408D511|nr:uncharacterized protein LOC131033531 [Cryptomeria japonica]GLJ13160.1 hypothetical protein SUGI_0206540 [Cryptomeria japonica]
MAKESSIEPKRRSPKRGHSSIVNNSTDNTMNSFTPSDIVSPEADPGFWGKRLGRNRKRFVGVRQRPSGRWVAEIKDTIQKIRLWLGTFDTAEDAARAYDEAACLLRGTNTRTNFWPSPSPQTLGTSALPSRTARRLLLRLKDANARNNTATMIANHNSSDENNISTESVQASVKVEGECISSDEEDAQGSSQVVSSTSEMLNNDEDKSDLLGCSPPKNPTPHEFEINGGFSVTGANDGVPEMVQKKQSSAEEECCNEGNMGFTALLMEAADSSITCVEGTNMKGFTNGIQNGFNIENGDELASGYSPFTMGAEITDPAHIKVADIFREEVEESFDCVGSFQTMVGEHNSTSLLREAMKRRMYERKISASLYAMNGISDYFQYTSEFAASPNLEESFRFRGADEIYSRSSETVSPQQNESSSSHYSANDSAEGEDSLEMLWDSWDLAPI